MPLHITAAASGIDYRVDFRVDYRVDYRIDYRIDYRLSTRLQSTRLQILNLPNILAKHWDNIIQNYVTKSCTT